MIQRFPEDDIPMQHLPYMIEHVGQHVMSLDQTRRVASVDLAGERPSTTNQWADIYDLEVELEQRGEGRLRVTIPHDDHQPGTFTWMPTTDVWIDESCTQELFQSSGFQSPEGEERHDKTGGKAIAAQLLAGLSRRAR